MLHRTEVVGELRPKSIQTRQKVTRTFTPAVRTSGNITASRESAALIMKSTDIWIGRFDVKPRPGNDALGIAKGAFVNVVALATDEDDYVQIVKAATDNYGFDIVRWEDVVRLSEWTKNNNLHRELEELARSLTREIPIQFDEFQSYLHDDA